MPDRVILCIGTKKGLFVAEANKNRRRFELRGPFEVHGDGRALGAEGGGQLVERTRQWAGRIGSRQLERRSSSRHARPRGACRDYGRRRSPNGRSR